MVTWGGLLHPIECREAAVGSGHTAGLVVSGAAIQEPCARGFIGNNRATQHRNQCAVLHGAASTVHSEGLPQHAVHLASGVHVPQRHVEVGPGVRGRAQAWDFDEELGSYGEPSRELNEVHIRLVLLVRPPGSNVIEGEVGTSR